jgi:hypothetical protein
MTLETFLRRGRKALRMPPRTLIARLAESARQRSRRPWARVFPHLVSERTLIGDSGVASLDALWARQAVQPFFLNPSDRESHATAFRATFPDKIAGIVNAADAALRHEFDLLGSGLKALGPRLPWLDDFKTGRHYPIQYCRDIEYMELDQPTDVKVPWELSRCQHFTALGQAYWLTGDEKYASEYRAEIEDWIANNPFAYSVNWACAMDVALRAISWIWGFYFMSASPACADAAFRRALLTSLFAHGEFVFQHLERGDVNGNHYLSDGVGLAFLGCFFRHTAQGRRWLAQGQAIVFDEMLLQTSEDGVDFEQSTAYHRLVLELFFTSYLLLERHGIPIPAAQLERLQQMLEFVAAYTKPNGLCPLIGDADDGRVQKLGSQRLNDHRYLLSTGAVRFKRADFKAAASEFWEETFWLLGPDGATAFDGLPAAATPATSAAFPAGGFFILRNDAAHVVIDCGEVGMRGRGGHGHNDITSFELYLDGTNVLTDCGAYLYTASREWRNHFRSTAFHNAVQVNHEELNRFVGPDALWQLQYDARPRDVQFAGGRGGYFRGAHDGYQRLSPPVWPVREIWMDPEQPVVALSDRVEGPRHQVPVRWRFHFDPALEAELVGADVRLRGRGREVWMLAAGGDRLSRRLESGWVSAAYGVRAPAAVLVVTETTVPGGLRCVFATTRLGAAGRDRALTQLDAQGTRT